MRAEFYIAADAEKNLLRVTMRGFFGMADVDAFVYALRGKLGQLHCGRNQHLMLCDTSRMAIQSQEIVDAFSRIVGHPDFRSKRLAFVVGSTLARLQAKRLTSREGVDFFSDRADAEAWLFEAVTA